MKSILAVILIMQVIWLAGCSQTTNSPKNLADIQLMQPATLAALISDPKADKPLIYSIGPFDDIPGTTVIGPAQDQENITKLQKALQNVPKDKAIVLYCGCCPFEHCPNFIPANKALTAMGFNNFKILNLSTNLKVDWLNKGYPVKP